MPEPYSVVQIQEEWLLDEPEEEMGSKRKFWYRREPDGVECLFKFPRPNTGEHWAEKIAAEVANLLGIPQARIPESWMSPVARDFAIAGVGSSARQLRMIK